MQQRVHCLDNGANVRFRASSTNPDPAGLLGQLFRQVNGDHQDGNFRKTFRDAPGRPSPLRSGIGKSSRTCQPDSALPARASLPSEPHLVTRQVLCVEKSPKVMPDRRVVIDHENSNQAVLPSTLCPRLSTAGSRLGECKCPTRPAIQCPLP